MNLQLIKLNAYRKKAATKLAGEEAAAAEQVESDVNALLEEPDDDCWDADYDACQNMVRDHAELQKEEGSTRS